jgi:hypothetical protein
MANYLTELFTDLGYENVSVTPEEALSAIQLMDRNGDNKLTKMELFLGIQSLKTSQLTDFGDVKIFFMGQQFGSNNNNNKPPITTLNHQNNNNGNFNGNNNNNQNPWNQNGNNWNNNNINRP